MRDWRDVDSEGSEPPFDDWRDEEDWAQEFGEWCTERDRREALPWQPTYVLDILRMETPVLFGWFAYLPCEIRTLIWKFALPRARVHRLLRIPWSGNAFDRDGMLSTQWLSTQLDSPVLFEACAESERIAKKYYKVFDGLVNDRATGDNLANDRRQEFLHFDFVNDTFFAPNQMADVELEKVFNYRDLRKVKNLAMSWIRTDNHSVLRVLRVLRTFPNVTKLTLVYTHGEDEFEGENDALRLEVIDLSEPMDTKGERRLRGRVDTDLLIWREKWMEQMVSEGQRDSWFKAPKLVFASLESDHVNTPQPFITNRYGCRGVYRRPRPIEEIEV